MWSGESTKQLVVIPPCFSPFWKLTSPDIYPSGQTFAEIMYLILPVVSFTVKSVYCDHICQLTIVVCSSAKLWSSQRLRDAMSQLVFVVGSYVMLVLCLFLKKTFHGKSD